MLGLLVVSIIHAAPDAPFEFRGLKWGSNQQLALQKIPGLVPRESPAEPVEPAGLTTLRVADHIDETPAELALSFEADRLMKIAVSLEQPRERAKLVADFRRKLSLLAKKYGPPTDKLDACLAREDMSVSQANCLTLAKISLLATWNRTDTTIMLLVSVDPDAKSYYSVLYFDVAAVKRRNALKDQAATEKL